MHRNLAVEHRPPLLVGAAAATVAQGFDAKLALQSGLRLFSAVLGGDSKCFAVSRSTKNWPRSSASLIFMSHVLFNAAFFWIWRRDGMVRTTECDAEKNKEVTAKAAIRVVGEDAETVDIWR